ncbi:MAG: family 10 glycosylhydrolase [Firmicutes bacterium]|nr:family 10 glycosylhydrolase [Bacillota bacterium]
MKRLFGLILLVSILSFGAFAYEDLRYGVAVYGQNATGSEENQAAYRKLADEVHHFVDWDFISIDIIDGDILPSEVLDGYKVLILPSLEGLDETLLNNLTGFANDGGKLIIAVDKTEEVPEKFFDLFGFTVATTSGSKATFVENNGVVDDKFVVPLESSLSLIPDKDSKVLANFESGSPAVILADNALVIAGNGFKTIATNNELKELVIEAIYSLGDDRVLTGFAPLGIEEWKPLVTATKSVIRQARSNIRSSENQYRTPSDKIYEMYEKANKAGELMGYAFDSGNTLKISPYWQIADKLAKEVIALNQPVRNYEARAVWMDEITIATSGNPRRLRETIREFADAGFNMILPEVVYQGATIFENDFGIQDQKYWNWEEDPLTVIVDEAHKLGMEVHVWTWVFCAGYGHKFGPILEQHPEWAEQDEAGRVFSNWQYGTAWLNASMPEVKEYLNELFAYIVSEYAVDGLHLDYIRYNEDSVGHFGLSPNSRQAFKKEHGFDPATVRINSPEWRIFNQWRENNVTSFVREMSETVRSINPDLKISAAVGPDPDYARSHILQNWKNWADNGILDFIITMAYTENNGTLRTNTNKGLEVTENNVYVYPGLGVYVNTSQNNVTQTQLSRSLGTTGVAMFSTIHLLKEPQKLEDLKNGAFREPAIIPHAEPIKSLKGLIEEAAAIHISAERDDTAKELFALADTVIENPEDIVSMMEQIASKLEVYLNALEKERNTRQITTIQYDSLSGALLSAWRITQINIYTNTERPWIEATPL